MPVVLLFTVTLMACVLETVTVHSAFTLPAVAVITAEPVFNAVTVPSSVTVATSSLSEDHTVESVVLEGVIVAVNLTVPPGSRALAVVSRATSVAGIRCGAIVRVLPALLMVNTLSYQESFFTEWKEKTTSFSR